MAGNDAARAACPVEDYATAGPRRAPLAYFERLDELRDRSRPLFRTETAQGYYVVVDHDAIVEGLQHPELFSSSVVVPEDPDPLYKWIPLMLDPPEHAKWRHLLASYFSPRTVERMADEQRAFVAAPHDCRVTCASGEPRKDVAAISNVDVIGVADAAVLDSTLRKKS